jgi:hypothetical protein
LNGDGDVDFLVADQTAGVVHLFLGSGDGTFMSAGELATASDTSWVTTDDVNGDRIPDVLTAHPVANVVSVNLGQGNALFDPSPAISVMGGPAAVLTGDFDSDEFRDLVVLGKENDSIVILLGHGDGTFIEAGALAAAGEPTGGAVADFDLDGAEDLAVINYSANSVSIFLGNTDGSFQPRMDIGVPSGPVWIASGDFNRDQIPDLAIASALQKVIVLLIGDGTGNFTRDPLNPSQSDELASKVPISIALGDFNRDGSEDLAVTSEVFNETGIAFLLSIFLGDGFGGLIGAPQISTGERARWTVVEDLDGDGHHDIATASQDSNELVFLMGDGKGKFAPGHVLTVGTGPRAIRAVDIDVDGDLDLIVSNLGDDTITILRGDGTGLFTRDQPDIGVGDRPRGLDIGDLNGDGWPDIVIGHDGGETITILYAEGPGLFDGNSAETRIVGQVPLYTLLEDLDQDGRLDIIVVNEEDDNLVVLWGSGQRTTIESGDNPRMVIAVDLTGDQIPDLATANLRDNTVSIMLGAEGGQFSHLVDVPVGLGPTAIGHHDFNDDGDVDFVVINLFSDSMTVLLGDGTGHFVRATDLDLHNGPLAVSIGDFNEDSRPDLAIANYIPGSTTVLLNSLRERADINGSNRIDGFDIAHLGLRAGSENGDQRYRRQEDVNLDGMIDGEDLTLVASSFGEVRFATSPLRGRLEPTIQQPNSITFMSDDAPGNLVRVRLVYRAEQVSMSSLELVVDFSPADGRPTQVLELVGKEIGEVLQGGVGRVLNIDSATLGRAKISLARLPEVSETVDGDVVLLTLIFRAIRQGEASLGLVADQSILYDGESPIGVEYQSTTVIVDVEDPNIPGQSIHVSPAELRFERTTDAGETDCQTLRVVNNGFSDLEVIRVESEQSSQCLTDAVAELAPAAFVPQLETPFTVPAFGFVEFGVRFTPPGTGAFAGCLALDSNDSERPLIHLSMHGESN